MAKNSKNHASISSPIVSLPLVLILERLVGLVDLEELLLGVLLIALVGVVLQSQLLECLKNKI